MKFLQKLIQKIALIVTPIAMLVNFHCTDFDPALAGGVILTTITDVIGFVVFLGLASLVV
jgi:Mg/Co/Ni transporter MgtE